MASLTDDEVRALDPIVQAQAKRVADRYDGVEPEDLAQEVWLWIVEDTSPAFYDYVQRGAIGLATRSIYNAAVSWCEDDRKRKLKQQGVNWRDQYNYTRPEIARLLPVALDPTTVPEVQGRELHDGPASKSDPAYGGGMLASLADIRSALAKLAATDYAYLKTCVQAGNEWDLIGPATQQQPNSAYAKYMRILDKMVKHLGRKDDDE